MNCTVGFVIYFLWVPLACLGSMAWGRRAGTSVELWENRFQTSLQYSSFCLFVLVSSIDNTLLAEVFLKVPSPVRSATAVVRTMFCKRNFSGNMTCDKTLLSMDVCFFMKLSVAAAVVAFGTISTCLFWNKHPLCSSCGCCLRQGGGGGELYQVGLNTLLCCIMLD